MMVTSALFCDREQLHKTSLFCCRNKCHFANREKMSARHIWRNWDLKWESACMDDDSLPARQRVHDYSHVLIEATSLWRNAFVRLKCGLNNRKCRHTFNICAVCWRCTGRRNVSRWQSNSCLVLSGRATLSVPPIWGLFVIFGRS